MKRIYPALSFIYYVKIWLTDPETTPVRTPGQGCSMCDSIPGIQPPGKFAAERL